MKKKPFLRRFLFFVFFLIISRSVFAQSNIFDRTGIIPGHGSYSSVPEESVDLFTGNVTLRYLDYYLPGPNGLDVKIWRVYNSKILKDRQSGNPSLQAERKSWVGIGWTMHMGRVHNYGTTTPIIEFPDGRFETAWPDNYPDVGKNITRDFLRYDRISDPTLPKLYFQDGTIWTFGAVRTITKGDSSTEVVRLVTKIENTYGQSITIAYDSNRSSINYITDACGRVIDFVSTGADHNNTKLSQMKVKNAENEEVVYSYTVSAFPNGYHKLTSFAPPSSLIPATTFEYYDGTNYRYELTKVTKSYGGVLEFSYVNHNFVFNQTTLDSRVASQKKITFNPGEQAIWNFTYPSYNGVPTGTATVVGPEYTTSVTNHGYAVACPWKIGLFNSQSVNDGSFSKTNDWTFQEISGSTWTVLGTPMGTAKGPLISTVIQTPLGGAASKLELLYERTETKKYGLPTKSKLYVNGGSTPKSYKELTYYYEMEGGGEGEFLSRYMLAYVYEDFLRSSAGTLLKQTKYAYYVVPGKYGALLRIEKLKTPPSTYTVWNYGYTIPDPNNPSSYYISVDPPPAGGQDASTVYYSYGVADKATEPGYTASERVISPYDSSITSEKNAFGAETAFEYDNLGRVTLIDLPNNEFHDIRYEYPANENKVVIKQQDQSLPPIVNTITKYWDGMGRDTGSTEAGDNTTLYFRKTLDAEGRVKEENRASIDLAHKYTYVYNPAGRITQITDPLNKVTRVVYSGTTRTVTDAKDHTTSHEYGDLPGLITKLTDAQGKIANYTYDAAGRLVTVVFNGLREQRYLYDYLDNVTSEKHPETGEIFYTYNDANRISGRSWGGGGSEIAYAYDTNGRLISKTIGPSPETVTYGYNPTSGQINSITSTKGWSRTDIRYNKFGSLIKEVLAIPGLPSSKTIQYAYDGFNNLAKITYPDGREAVYTSNDLKAPESVAFSGTSLVSSISYGPGKAATSMNIAGNGTTYSAGYNAAGMPTTVSLIKGAATLYNATYSYDGVGNITGISSTAPALNAAFGYDSINRLTSAAYSAASGNEAHYTYSYEYDEYGNMKKVYGDGNPIFDKTYDSSNRIDNYSYDSRGNLLSSGGNVYAWDSQNRLSSLTNISGDILGKYLYDDSGLRLFAIPAESEIAVTEGGRSVVDGGFVDFYAVVGPADDQRTFTITNTGDANLILSGTPIITITEGDAGDFDVIQQPGSPVFRYGGTTTFIIQFDPQTTGVKVASISIASNDPDEGSYEITLNGYNGPPEIDVWEAPDGGTLDFGTCAVDDYILETFTIENLGDAPLYLDHNPLIEITGQDAGQFHIDSQPGTNKVDAGSYTQFVVRFEPRSPGDKTAMLRISSNDSDEDPYEITITGYGEMGPRSPGLSVTSPNGEESLKPGSAQAITWSGEEAIKSLKLEYSLDNGTSYMSLAERAENSGTYPWQIPYILSPSCLARVSSADGSLLRPEVVSYELNFKVESPIDAVATGAHLRLRLGIPDLKSQSFRFAEISFLPDSLEGTENVVFNQTQAKYGGLKDFLSTWHRLQVLYDLNVYAGTLLLDGQVILKDLPLQLGPWVNSLAEVSISCDKDVAAAVWVDDLEFKLQDAGFSPEDKSSTTLLLLAVAKDGFEGYKSEEFPLYGGWITSQELIAEDAALPIVDKYEYASGMQSLRLKSGDGGAALMVKRFALPERFPFDTSDGTFAIANEAQVFAKSITAAESLKKASGARAGDRERVREERQGRRQKAAKSTSREDSEATSTKSSRSPKAQAGAGADTSTRALSASANGGSFYIYSITGVLLAEYSRSDDNVPVKDYIYVGGRLLAEYKPQGNRTYFYTPDQINSTRIVTDESGSVVYSAAHNPFGGIQQTWENTYDPTPKFSGKERDSESQLDYFGARYYDRLQYRFISVDPIANVAEAIENPQLMNLYAYCRNNPITYVDPGGQYSVLCIIFIRHISKGQPLRDKYGRPTLRDGKAVYDDPGTYIIPYTNSQGQASLLFRIAFSITMIPRNHENGWNYDNAFLEEENHVYDILDFLEWRFGWIEYRYRKNKNLVKARKSLDWAISWAQLKSKGIRDWVMLAPTYEDPFEEWLNSPAIWREEARVIIIYLPIIILPLRFF
jgi:RHS repeat-associated protein